MFEVKIKGMAELEKLLNELPDKIEKNIIRSALRAGAKVVQQRAADLAPKHSQRLAESVRVKVNLQRGKPVATITAGGNKKGQAFYARFVEFGTAAHYIKPKKAKSLFVAGLLREGAHHPGAKKHPFMRPALDASAGAAVLAFGQQVAKRLNKQGIDTPDLELDQADS